MSDSHTFHTKVVSGGRALEFDSVELRVTSGPDRGLRMTLGVDSLLIGTSSSCDVVLHDRTVSSRHAEISIDGEYVIRDLGSTNGILLGGHRILRAPLVDGMRLSLGDTTFTIRASGKRQTVDLSEQGRIGTLVAQSVKMRAFVAQLERFAATDITVLIEGETGTGKEVAAQALHDASARRQAPFIVFHCGATNATLLQAQLFGHERGAFTGANEARAGLFEEADGGTLFLDEIADLPLEMQPMLLRVLESRSARRLGGRSEISYDVRLVATTQHNLSELVRARQFREDLFHRLSVGRMRMPPLRERIDDLPELAKLFGQELGTALSAELLAPMASYEWPGNVRELKNAVARLAARPEHERHPLPIAAASEDTARTPPKMPALHDLEGQLRPLAEVRRVASDSIERFYVEEVLRRADNNLSKAAELAGITRQALTKLAQKHGLKS